MLGIVYQIILLQLTMLTFLNIDWMHTGRIRTLYMIFMLNYKEPEVVLRLEADRISFSFSFLAPENAFFYFSAFYFSAEKNIRIFVSFSFFSVLKWP